MGGIQSYILIFNKEPFFEHKQPIFFINTKPALITADMYQKKGEKAIRTEPGKKKDDSSYKHLCFRK